MRIWAAMNFVTPHLDEQVLFRVGSGILERGVLHTVDPAAG